MKQCDLQKEAIDGRKESLQQWFQGLFPEFDGEAISPVSGDASFRRYFRGRAGQQSYILVDAPVDKEDSRPFVAVATKFLAAGIQVPEVYEADFEQGFMCLSDFGDTLLWEKLNAAQQDSQCQPNANTLYQMAFTELAKIQHCEVNTEFSLPLFDEAMLHREMGLFKEWFCEGLLGLKFDAQSDAVFASSFNTLVISALAQPQVCVHRDYHSRNFLYQDGQDLGVIDFQDAVLGPFTYDLVSLLKDCYIAWPTAQVNQWALEYANLAREKNIISSLNEDEFLLSFDLMGVQRHLKAVGIFSRLYLRDNKAGYLADIPRTLTYILNVVEKHEALHELSKWLEAHVVPCVENKIQTLLAQEKALS